MSTRNAADLAYVAIRVQHDRSDEPLSDVSILDPSHGAHARLQMLIRILDVEHYILALNRLRALATVTLRLLRTSSADEVKRRHVGIALKALDTVVPRLSDMRNRVEHGDDYILGLGNLQKKGEDTNFGFGLGGGEVSVTYGTSMFLLSAATEAARQLHHSIRLAIDELAYRDVHGKDPLLDAEQSPAVPRST